MSRFNRNYKVEIQLKGFDFIILPPLRIQFGCVKGMGRSVNKLTLKIFNLTKAKRDALVKDAEDRTYIPFTLWVGYGDDLGIMFKGSVHIAKTERSGTDLITTIESLDGGHDFLNSFTSKTVKNKGVAVDEILKDMPNTLAGKITKQNALIRPKVIVGNSVKMIEDQLNDGESYFIEEEKLYIMKEDEYIGSFIPLVRADTGLINAPTRQEKKVTFTTLTNPTLKVGGLCELESVYSPHLNGTYKIEYIEYKGDTYGTDWNQNVTAYSAQGLKRL